ncbi:MAG: GNAT family N-acetyltransferase, partial [Gammaproteobacteria bacterium]|nr:GNAT family N-acetyltransferase [Gammaproteobacteria bacterium]
MKKAVELHSRNCRLRALAASDGDLMAEMFGEAEVVRYSRINPLSADEAEAMLLRWLSAPDDAYWAVVDNEERKIGVIFLRNVNHAHRAGEIGYMLTR